MQGFSTYSPIASHNFYKGTETNRAALPQIWGGSSTISYLPLSLKLTKSRYIPPDQEGLTTANKLANKHPLGARARHLQTKGALVVRFEMPFAVWCTTCSPENIIGQGVRFNAEKKKIGNYHSTPVYSFRMKHVVCGGWIEIHTDPRNTAYVVVEGGRKRDMGVDEEGKGVGEIFVPGRAGTGAGDDPFSKLEGKVEDKRVVDEAKSRILELQRRQARDWDDPYEVSRRLRRGFRTERKGLEKKEAGKEALKEKMSLGIDIVDEVEEDARRAAMVEFDQGDDTARGVRARPMFGPTSLSPRTSGGDGDEKKRKSGKRKTAELLAERKASFRSELAGNTRAAVDPFLNGDTSNVWEPDVKKRKALGKVEAKRIGDRPTDGDGQTTRSDVEDAPGEVSEKNLTGTSAALVDYGSDTE
ncbi:CWC16 protein [Aspergillus varians]